MKNSIFLTVIIVQMPEMPQVETPPPQVPICRKQKFTPTECLRKTGLLIDNKQMQLIF